jgi:hypothetical protein
MSAQPHESTAPEGGPDAPPVDPYAGQAQATVDVLPAAGGRKQPKPEPEPVVPQGYAPADYAHPAADPTWGAPAPVDPTWGAPAAEAVPPAQPVEAPVQAAEPPAHTPLVYAGSIPPPVSVPVFPGGGVPAQAPVPQAPVAEVPVQAPVAETGEDVPTEAPSAKRFLGMQLRRPRRGDVVEAEAVEPGPQAPVAAWPTDVAVTVVATAEPAEPVAWGAPVAPPAFEPVPVESPPDVLPVEALPVEPAAVEAAVEPAAVEAAPVEPAPVDAALEAAPVDVAPVETTQVDVAPVDAAPVGVAAIQAVPFEPVPVEVVPAVTPVPAPLADDELRTLRTSLEASDARRVAAEQRADNAVAYAQQLQAELTQVRSDLEAKVQAAEVKIRTVANESQDWQIRHREAQAQIAELATSLAGAEQRLAEVRAERDDLMTQLEEATAPVGDEVAAELDA